MKKCLLSLLASLVLVISAFTAESYSFGLTLPFRVDDFEEIASNLNVQGVSSNTNLIPTITILPGSNPNWKTLTLLSKPNTSGNAQISINVCDNGYTAGLTPLLSITPNTTVTTNSDSTNIPSITLIGSNNAVHLRWYASSNKFGYKINRFSTNNFTTDKYFTIGTTSGTNFTDTNVVNGTKYWYTVTWIPYDVVSSPTDVLCTNIVFEFRVRSPIELRPNPLGGLCFLSRSNTTYQVFYKTNALQPLWALRTEINTLSNKLILLNGDDGFYGKNIIYVREKE